MPKLVCDCGTTYRFTNREIAANAGKPFTCRKCGKSRKLPSPDDSSTTESGPLAAIQALNTTLTIPDHRQIQKSSSGMRVASAVLIVVCFLSVYGIIKLLARSGEAKQPILAQEAVEPLKDAVDANADGDVEQDADEQRPLHEAKDQPENAAPAKPEDREREPAGPAARRRGVAKRKVDDGLLQAAVRNWLKENLDDGEFEEVRWWPAESLFKSYVFPLGSDKFGTVYRTWKNPDGNDAGFWHQITEQGNSIRFKFRAKNRLGAKVLADNVFILDTNARVTDQVDAIDFRLPNETIDEFVRRMADKPEVQQGVQANKANAAMLEGFLNPAMPGMDQPNAPNPKKKAKQKQNAR